MKLFAYEVNVTRQKKNKSKNRGQTLTHHVKGSK